MKVHNVPKEYRRLILLDGETPEDEHNETTAICVVIEQFYLWMIRYELF